MHSLHQKSKTDSYFLFHSGQFEILDDPDKGVYCRLQAFLPRWVERKAYFFSLSLPSLLSFKLISRNVPWDEMFKDNPPDENDVVFYLLPEFSDRSKTETCKVILFQFLVNVVIPLHLWYTGVGSPTNIYWICWTQVTMQCTHG